MGFTSQIYPNEIIIDDSTPFSVAAPPDGMSRGLQLWLKGPEGYAGVAEPFPADWIIPPSEVQARIQELEETKSNLSSIADAVGMPPLDQNGTNFCWINGPTYAVQLIRAIQNQELVLLSPASAGAPIKGFRNEGGWGKEGLEWIAEKGLVPVGKWPPNAISRQYYTEENKALALQYRVTEWMELQPRNKEQIISCLLRRVPVAVGYNWWGHEVCAVDAVWVDGEANIRIRNSWGNWGDRGYGILKGSKMLADDQVAPRVATAS